MKKEDVIIFGDQVGRLIIGENVGGQDDFIKVKNPLVVNITQQNGGQSGLNFIPYVYLELLENFGVDFVWTFNHSVITLNDGAISEQAFNLYKATIDTIAGKHKKAQAQDQEQTGGQPVQLFDE